MATRETLSGLRQRSIAATGVTSIDVQPFMVAIRNEYLEEATRRSADSALDMYEEAEILRTAQRVEEVLRELTPRLVWFLIQSENMTPIGASSFRPREIQI